MSVLDLSARMLIAAILILVAGGAVTFGLEGSDAAISAIGGVFEGQAPNDTARVVLAVDFLFPVFYGAGLILLAIGLQSAAKNLVIGAFQIGMLVCALLVVAVAADFIENGQAMAALAGEGGMTRQPSMATLVKYGLIALSGPLLSLMIFRQDWFSRAVILVLRYLAPICLVIPATNAFPALTKLTPLSFILFLGALAVFAKREAGRCQ